MRRSSEVQRLCLTTVVVSNLIAAPIRAPHLESQSCEHGFQCFDQRPTPHTHQINRDAKLSCNLRIVTQHTLVYYLAHLTPTRHQGYVQYSWPIRHLCRAPSFVAALIGVHGLLEPLRKERLVNCSETLVSDSDGLFSVRAHTIRATFETGSVLSPAIRPCSTRRLE